MRRLLTVTGIILSFTGFCFLRAGTLAQFRSPLGDVEVELYDQDKPVTVQNFIRYVQSGAFQNEFAHRLVPGFVLQGGGFAITNRGTTNWTVFAIPSYPPITNEFAVGRRFSNVYGTIAMAKLGGDTNSATSQWFFNLVNNSFLDAADTNNLFVVFGHVVRGTNVLNVFNGFQYYSGTQTSNLVAAAGPPPFDTLPLLQLHNSVVWDTNLVFIDITLLQVAVANLPGGTHQISWNSAAGMTNVVEFTTNLPPIWNTLIQTNGTGARISVTDATAASNRFYRVRIPY
jgi:cyclophilin family peptidyl-prolyl cis-trans isomerase